MRMLMIFAAALTLAGCATAVYDSLERRGVDARSLHIERVTEARADAATARASFDNAAAALAGVDGIEGSALARQIDEVRAAGQDAALAAQELRLSADTVKSSGARFFRGWEEEIALYEAKDERDAAASRLAVTAEAHRAFLSSLDAAGFRLSPALSLYDREATALRRSPTSSIAVKARGAERQSAQGAAADASQSLEATIKAADRYLEALK